MTYAEPFATGAVSAVLLYASPALVVRRRDSDSGGSHAGPLR